MSKYLVNEIFDTVKGEGAYLGEPATFVRLANCNLRCDHCDTEFLSPIIEMDEGEILKRLSPKIHTVVITGGEPTIQNLDSLLIALIEAGYSPHLETNGTRRIHDLFAWVCVSPKLKYMEPLYESMMRADEIKMPISEKEDIEEAEKFRVKFPESQAIWYLHPWNDLFMQFKHGKMLGLGAKSMDGYNRTANKLCVDHAVSTGKWRVSIQAHKVLGVR